MMNAARSALSILSTLRPLGAIAVSACRRPRGVHLTLCRDYLGGRRERTAGGLKVEGEMHTDGSGFEVSFRGRVLILGVVPRSEQIAPGHAGA